MWRTPNSKPSVGPWPVNPCLTVLWDERADGHANLHQHLHPESSHRGFLVIRKLVLPLSRLPHQRLPLLLKRSSLLVMLFSWWKGAQLGLHRRELLARFRRYNLLLECLGLMKHADQVLIELNSAFLEKQQVCGATITEVSIRIKWVHFLREIPRGAWRRGHCRAFKPDPIYDGRSHVHHNDFGPSGRFDHIHHSHIFAKDVNRACDCQGVDRVHSARYGDPHFDAAPHGRVEMVVVLGGEPENCHGTILKVHCEPCEFHFHGVEHVHFAVQQRRLGLAHEHAARGVHPNQLPNTEATALHPNGRGAASTFLRHILNQHEAAVRGRQHPHIQVLALEMAAPRCNGVVAQVADEKLIAIFPAMLRSLVL
mmetsp:Transcript_18168/g.46133  ORF Transcript_18168/g.46133 Transcript_18168/m.46133 type:complete len:368 (-) Transcript_18168:364-1467(-)